MEKLRDLRKRKGWTQEEFGDMLGINKVTVSGYESGKRQPTPDMLSKMADLLGVSVDVILEREEEHTEPFGRPIVIQPELVSEDEVLIPVVASLRCGFNSAGQPVVFTDRKPVPVSWTRRWGPNIVYVDTVGDSMVPTICPGDLCVCVPGSAWESGNIVVIDINDSDTVKRIYRSKDGGIDLVPDNTDFDTMHLTPEDCERYQVRVLGRIVKVVSPDL